MTTKNITLGLGVLVWGGLSAAYPVLANRVTIITGYPGFVRRPSALAA